MPSKELIEKVATVLNEQEGCYFQPQDYHRGAAKEVLSTILSALQEPSDRMKIEGAMTHMAGTQACGVIWKEMLAASALGEQAE